MKGKKKRGRQSEQRSKLGKSSQLPYELDISVSGGFNRGCVALRLLNSNNNDVAGSGLWVSKPILAGTSPSSGNGMATSANIDVNDVAGAQNITINAFRMLLFP